jgi:hypothetical protein
MRRGPLAVRCKIGIGANARTDGDAHYIPADRVSGELVKGELLYVIGRWLCTRIPPRRVVLLPADHGRTMCIHCEDHLHPTVYRCFGEGGELVYVGSSITRTRRLRQHRKYAPWWPLVADVRFEEFPTIADAFRAEQVAIRAEDPSHNRRPDGRRWAESTAA